MKNDSIIVADLLRKASVFYLATSVKEQPCISILNSVVEYNEKLFLAIHQAESKQISINPKIALLAILPTKIIEIKAQAVSTTDEAAYKQLINKNPHLAINSDSIFHDLKLIVLTNAEVHIRDISGDNAFLQLE